MPKNIDGGDLRIIWVTDIDDPFVPLPKQELMLKLKEDRDRIDFLLDKLVSMYFTEARKNLPIYTCQGAAMSACK